MSWFTMPEVLLYCETCKAHIEEATYTGTILQEGSDRNGFPSGFYAVTQSVFCARCRPDHDIVIVPYYSNEPIRLNTSTRTLTDRTSKAIVAQVTADAVIDALAAAAEALAGGDAEALDDAQATAATAHTEALVPAPPVSERRAPIT